jgi:Fe-S oxidoreductase
MTPLLGTLAEPASFSLAEKLILVALMAASICLFWLRFRRVLTIILATKPDPGFKLFPLAPRLKDFILEVLFQAKVIRQRPLPGLAHAFVFWAFLVFALVTLNHCAVGLGVGFLDSNSGLGRFYFLIAALFAIACDLGIAALFVRRFVLRPPWLGQKLSYESGVIAALIFVLMTTYLAAFLASPTGAGVRILWWLHTLALLGFLPLIPRTKHLHLVLSPAAVFLSRGGFSHIPPLEGDEDFGLVAGTDVTRLAALEAYSCVECGRCTEHCPAANTGKVLNPKEIVLGLRGYLNESGPGSSDPLLGRFIPPQAPFQCTTCGACEFQCPVGVEHLPLLIGLRRGAVNTGDWVDEAGGRLFTTLERTGNPLGGSAAERDKFIQRLQLPIFDGSQQYCLWLGCMGAYDPKGREIIASLTRILDHLGISYGVLRRERCSGDSARRLGNDLLFQQLAEANLETLAQSGVKNLLSICPHCVRTIQEDWKEFGCPPAIEHHTEFLARFADRLPHPQNGERIVFHDPCYLGRYRNIYDQPRQLVSLAGTLTEAPRSRERSFCCGAGGGLAFLGEETGSRISHNRAKELVETGADAVAAACPFCNTMLGDALASGSSPAPPLLDIAQLVARGLPALPDKVKTESQRIQDR